MDFILNGMYKKSILKFFKNTRCRLFVRTIFSWTISNFSTRYRTLFFPPRKKTSQYSSKTCKKQKLKRICLGFVLFLIEDKITFGYILNFLSGGFNCKLQSRVRFTMVFVYIGFYNFILYKISRLDFFILILKLQVLQFYDFHYFLSFTKILI